MRLRWPLGLIGVAVLLPSLAAAILLQLQGISVLPLADDALDAGHVTVTGRIETVEPLRLQLGGRQFERVTFSFLPGLADGSRLRGRVVTPHDAGHRPGDRCMVEFASADPAVNRLQGSRRNPLDAWTTPLLGLVLMPSLLAVLWWLRGMVRLRLLLSTGTVRLARIEQIRRVPVCTPSQLRVEYSAPGIERSWHWVPAGSSLGRRLAAGTSSVPIVHNDDGGTSRLAAADDFRA